MITSLTAPAPIDGVSHAALVARMKAIVGTDNVLTAAADLVVYECDGFTIEKNKPDVVVFPTIDRAGRRDREGVQRARRAVPAARRRDEPGRRLPAGRRRRDDRARRG